MQDLLEGVGETARFEMRYLCPDGSLVWVDVTVRSLTAPDGEVVGFLTQAVDISNRKDVEVALEHQALHDALTGLANKALFVDRVVHALHRADRHLATIGVLLLDLDDFHTVNAGLGHVVGDELLVAVAQRLAAIVRTGDTVARLGGDEFAVLLESGPMPQVAVDMAGRIAGALRAPFRVGSADISVRASIGVTIGCALDVTSDGLLRDADLAMYRAKQNGKDRFEMFRAGMQDDALKRLALTTDLRYALDHGELEVFYQTIVSARDAWPVGAEALVRWHHPVRGLVPPLEFIGAAEASGLIVPLGDWVLSESCRQVGAWREAGVVDDDFYVSVNLSARQLAEPTLVGNVARALQESGLPPRALVLEITESAFMIDFDIGLARLEALKRLGLRLALDDYGTGYSSLNRLGRLPVDIVKIDKSFIDRLTVDAEGAALVRSVIDVTRALGLSSIAEGVEWGEQRAALEMLGCDCIQGYLFAKPTPAANAQETLSSLQADHVPAGGNP
jgi:diguanylate cyclase (GGDEF)-like protein